MEKTEKVKYQTWLVKVNLDNERSNYEHIVEQGESLLQMSDYDFKVALKNEFSYHDVIDWEQVDLKEIRESIADSI